MNRLNDLLPKGSFARSVSILVSGTLGSQALLILATPLLTRLYSPEDFGLLAAFTAILAFLSVISAGRYDLAIPLPEDKQDSANLLVLSLGIVFFITVISFIIFFLYSDNIASLMKSPRLAHYLPLIPVGVLFGGVYQVFSKWSIREKSFGIIARTKIYQSVATLSIQLLGYKLGVLSLILGHASGQGVGATSLAKSALREKEFRNITIKDIKKQAIRYKDFPIYSSPTALFNVASLQFAPLILISLYGATVSGFYALTLRILSLPISLVGGAIGNVFLSEAPKANREGKLPDLILSLHNKLSLVGALPLAVLLFFGPEIFKFVFGPQWLQAGVYAQWMAPWIYLQLQWSPLSTLASVLELQLASLVSQILTFVFRFGSLLICWWLSLAPETTIYIFSAISAITYFFRLLWFTNRANVSSVKIIKHIILHTLISNVIIGCVWILIQKIKYI